ncbi:ATP-binding protein [Microvirga sp. GCM10011540]|uniref:hybrid sensor histidine kinase/response regulator n=1 Tax=Microvirga sp. GCM10011540 TaxID=3317338 RepID=UPI00360A423A
MPSSGRKLDLKNLLTHSPAIPEWLHHSSLLWRFVLIGIATLAPLISALVQFAGNERTTALKNIRQRAEYLAFDIAEDQQHRINEARSILGYLALAPEIRLRGSTCDRFLLRSMMLHSWMTELRLLGPDGQVICTAMPAMTAPDASEHDELERILRTKNFTIVGPSLDPKTKAVRMTAALPVHVNGSVLGILLAGVDPQILRNLPSSTGRLPSDLNILLVDPSGVLVAHYPSIPGLIGKRLWDHTAAENALLPPTGVSDAFDLLGVERVFATRGIPETGAVIAVGIDKASAIGAIDEALRYRLILISLIIAGSVLLGALGAEILIFRPLRNLARIAGALEQGNFSIRPVHEGAGEVRVLARTLDRMAEAVADRERELKRARDLAEEALSGARQANSAKTDFMATMSHEIRTPLNGIIGYTEQLLNQDLRPQERRYAELIQVAGSALLTVANDILDFSSIEAEQVRLQAETFSLRQLVNDTVSIVRSGAGKKNVPIQISLNPNVPDFLVGDETRLRQILLNLLNNAVKFTREGHIETRVEYKGKAPAGELIWIAVTDTGIGIAPEKLDRLFKRFSQVDPSIRREFGGTGLGLAISKRLIELMGGEIGVISEHGQGSTFWVQVALPLAEAPPKRWTEPEQFGPVKPARILLAEDIDINQELARTVLEAAGHAVEVVCNGEEALAAVQAKPYDLVLMDIQMPGMDGITATRAIRALGPPAGEIPIIAMTANALPDQVRTFKEAGFSDYLCKPARRRDLLKVLGERLGTEPEDKPAIEPSVRSMASLNTKDFEDFLAAVGPDLVEQWLTRLDEQLEHALPGSPVSPIDHTTLASTAHAIIPQAALLGFSELADACIALEQSCATGTGLSGSLDQAQKAASVARVVIADLRRHAGQSGGGVPV